MALQPTRFTCIHCHQRKPCALTARFHPYLLYKNIGGLFSVALSVILNGFEMNVTRMPGLSAGVVLCAVRTFLTANCCAITRQSRTNLTMAAGRKFPKQGNYTANTFLLPPHSVFAKTAPE